MIGALHAPGGHGDPWTTWALDPLPLAGALLALTLYLAGWSRLRGRRRPDLASWPRATAFAGGLALIVLAVVSPLDEVGEHYLLWGHMVQHLLLADLAPLLLAVGVSGPLSLFVIPAGVLRGLARTRPLRALLRLLARPISALVVWALVMVGWHLPAAYEYSLAHRWAHDLQHASMVLAGLLVWIHVLAAVPKLHASAGRRAGLAVGVFAVGLVISQWLFLSEPLYDVYAEQPERLLDLSPAGDQARAGLTMGTEQLLTLGTTAFVLIWIHLERIGRADVSATPGAGSGT